MGSGRVASARYFINEIYPNMDLATKLIERGARVTSVCAITGIPPEFYSGIYKAIHGKKSPKGMLPSGAVPALKNLQGLAEGAMFIQCYESITPEGKWDPLDYEAIIKAHDLVREMVESCGGAPALNMTMCLMVGFEMRSRVIKTKKCPTCKLSHIYQLEFPMTHSCPFCKMIRLGLRRWEKKEQT